MLLPAGAALDELGRRGLVYNTCWEDPALDRVALDLGPTDHAVVITSAGCNSLDYLLAGAGRVTAVDVNPAQNALLELKATGIRRLEHESFFTMFGRGQSPEAVALYHDLLRPDLSDCARRFWDRNIRLFTGRGPRRSFFYHGGSGSIAWLIARVIRRDRTLRSGLEQIITAPDLSTQRAVYDEMIRDRLLSAPLRALLSRRGALALLGVPATQWRQVLRTHGNVPTAIMRATEAVLTRMSFASNYFWRLYFEGSYLPDCCPEFLKTGNFALLKAGLIDRLHIRTSSLTAYLHRAAPAVSKISLLDHMDWMAWRDRTRLAEEWTALLAAAPGARAIFRSAAPNADFLEHLPVGWRGRTVELAGLLRYDKDTANALHTQDRVHTYGSFHIADLPEGR